MRIIYFHQHFSTPNGSTGIRSYEMAKALTAKGHQVTMVCGSYTGGVTGLEQPFVNGKREGTVDGIHVIELELDYANEQSFLTRSIVFFKFALRSVKLALFREYDVIFCTTTPLTAGIPGIFAKVFRRKSFIFEVRDLWPELPKAMGVITNPVVLSLLAALEWLTYKCADRHIALSPGIASGIARHVESDHITAIPNGCDLTIFANPDSNWQPEGINDNDFVALFSGTHGLANGLDQLIEVAKELKQRQQKHIKLVLIGQGREKAKLMTLASQHQLSNILFLEPVAKPQLAQLMQRANVGLQVLANIPAFYYGTSPNKFFDYIAAGLPVINNYPGWLAEMIETHQCGIAVTPEDPIAFADALVKMQSEPELCEKMAVNAQNLARTQFSREQLSLQFIDVFESLEGSTT
ncbi:glycosyltransferase family 4 protein [Thalassotalea fusca]